MLSVDYVSSQPALQILHLKSKFFREFASVCQRGERTRSSSELHFDVGINTLDEPFHFACRRELGWSVVHGRADGFVPCQEHEHARNIIDMNDRERIFR